MTGVQTCALPICFPVTIEELCKSLFLYGFEEKRRDEFQKKVKRVREAQAGFQAKEEAELARLQAKMDKTRAQINQRIGVQLGMAEVGRIWDEVRK